MRLSQYIGVLQRLLESEGDKNVTTKNRNGVVIAAPRPKPRNILENGGPHKLNQYWSNEERYRKGKRVIQI